MRRCKIAIVTAWFAMQAMPIAAADLLFVDVEKSAGRYTITSEVWFDANPVDVFSVLIDYDHYDRISSVFKESRYVERNKDGSGIVYTLVEGCFLVVCRTIERTESLEIVRHSKITATVDPDASDLRFSRAIWELQPHESGTHLRYRVEMEPDFWIPPVIGPAMLRWSLRRGGKNAVLRIENLALERSATSTHLSD